MTSKPKPEAKPWQPEIEREPEFNAFVNPLDSELENPPPSENSGSDDGESTHNTAEVAGKAPST
jgi:hypothetical protein